MLIGPFVRDIPPASPVQAALTNAMIDAGLLRPWGATAWGAYYASLYPTAKPADFPAYRAALQANLAALGYWGAQAGPTLPLKLALGLGAPLLLVLVWATFVAPQASMTLPAPAPFLLGLLILGLAAGGLAVARRATWGAAFGALVLLNAALMAVWRQ